MRASLGNSELRLETERLTVVNISPIKKIVIATPELKPQRKKTLQPDVGQYGWKGNFK